MASNRDSAMRRLKSGTVINSPVSGERYQLHEALGQGGFGCAYRAHRLDSRDRVSEQVCLKATEDSESWHRESYFGELLKKCDRAIRMHESFPLFPLSRQHGVLYCLVSELAEFGTIRDELDWTRKPWSQKRAVKEIIALLKVLDQLHGTGALHRDITPMNVFVCRNKCLKLGDFGIAKHVLAGGAAEASVFNPLFVSNRMAQGAQRYWLASDDVYQMGQLLGMLLLGSPDPNICEENVKSMSCDDGLKRIVTKAICHRKSRYPNAHEMLRALLGDNDHVQPALESLAGKRVAFTGPLSIRRFDAEVMVRQSGGFVATHVTSQVDVVVQGRRSPTYSHVHKGDKLRQAERLIRQGHIMCIINEEQFHSLVGL
jgi:eukaryotic-like serine/threonine-protein kinase